MSSRVVEILSKLIACPSVNPRLSLENDPSAGETRVTAWLEAFAQRFGWRSARQGVHPQRDNFLAIFPGEREEVLLWEAHQDTVAVAGMTVEPFAATIRDGRVYGRGACDVKGGLAAMLAALLNLSSKPASQRPTILLASTVNEECGFTGARALADLWRNGGACAELRGELTTAEVRALRPSAAIIAEPTGLDIVVAHRGAVRWQCIVEGRAAHSSRPELGANAVSAMAQVVQTIDEYQRSELSHRTTDPLCGGPSACVTTIRGGTGANTVPDRAAIDVDRRLSPEEAPDAAYRELIAYLEQHCDVAPCRILHEPPWMQSLGMRSSDQRWSQQVAAAVQSFGRPGRLVGVPYGTNAASIAAAGIPTVVLGPGSIDQAHTADEWIAVEELEAAVEVYERIAV